MSKQPNILWICSDQQRWDTLGCYGNQFVRTPHIDRLAEGGVLFENAFCQNPVCTPSRASFLTGRYPRTTRDRMNGQDIPEDEILVTRLLADAGYTGGLSGKLHLSACNPKACPDTERRINDGYSVFHWSHHPGPDWEANEYIQWLEAKGQKYTRAKFRDSKYTDISTPAEFHQTTWCAEKAIDFIKARKGEPWFFSVNMFDPHPPFDPPEEYLERYLDFLDEIPLPNYTEGEFDGKPEYQGRAQDPEGLISASYPALAMMPEEHRLLRAAYWAMCDLIDDQVGRMLECLEETGQRENTIVIYMSDHGEMLGDHGRYRKGCLFYEEAVHVPLIISWPGVIEPGKSEALVELTDITPALVEACGLDHPGGMQGKSLWPMLTGAASRDGHREDVYSEFYAANHDTDDKRPHATMVRTESHKLIRHHWSGEGELYDLIEDPTEIWNLFDNPDHTGIKADLLGRLSDRMAWTIDPLPASRAPW